MPKTPEEITDEKGQAETARQKRIDEAIEGFSIRINDLTAKLGELKDTPTKAAVFEAKLADLSGAINALSATRKAVEAHRAEPDLAAVVDEILDLFDFTVE